jgi:hypothetical protein
MKPRLHIGWVLFALVMVWGESIADVPRLLFHRAAAPHLLMALANTTAVVGLTLYAFRWARGRAFWRYYAPLYALVVVWQLGHGLIYFTRALVGIVKLGTDVPLLLAGAFAVSFPLIAMAVFTAIALFRLGDWIGPTRRPVGERQNQLSLPF